jgi:putative ABC transport system permease protein
MKSHRLGVLETVVQDIRYGWRGLLRVPNFTIPALLALMLGIGSTTATFSVVDRLLFRSLPYPDSERLVSFGVMAPLDTSEFVLSADWPEWRAAATTFESVATLTPDEGVCDFADDSPIRVSCVPVEATFLKTFGIPPLIGRDFTSDEDRPKGPHAAIISYRLWQSRFGGS